MTTPAKNPRYRHVIHIAANVGNERVDREDLSVQSVAVSEREILDVAVRHSVVVQKNDGRSHLPLAHHNRKANGAV